MTSSNRTIAGEFNPVNFIAIGSNGYIVTPTKIQQLGTTEAWKSIAYGNGKYVIGSTFGNISTSTDGENWTTPKKIDSNPWQWIMYENGIFVAVGSSYISTSRDGIIWTELIPISSIISGGVQGAGHGGGFFAISNNNGYTATSTDGVTWTRKGKGATSSYAIGCSENRFISVTNGGYLYVSEDAGQNWKLGSTGNISPHKITYGKGVFVGGYHGKIGYAFDTEYLNSFYETTVGTSEDEWISTDFGKETFISISKAGKYVISSDGENWTDPVELKDSENNVIKAVFYDVCIIQ